MHITIPRNAINPDALHDWLLSQHPAWRGAPQEGRPGAFHDPTLLVEYTDSEIWLTVPDPDVDILQQLLNAYPGG